MTNGITFTKAYATSDGKTFSNLQEAQKHALRVVINVDSEAVLAAIVDNSNAIIDILSTTPTSRPRGRKSHGAVRKPKTTAQASNQ